MIKVFLAEDELHIRNGIREGIEWEKEGYEFVGEAGDGEIAYPLILQTKPDILLTDIKMPFMDGLELSEAVKKELPDIKIIILSGYNDFEFAQKGIEIGITNYLLKPVSAEELLEAIGEVAERIQKEKEEKEILKKYEEELQGKIVYEKRDFFTKILTENMSLTDILNEGKHLGMELSAAVYNVVLFKLTNYGMPEFQQQLVSAYMDVQAYMEKSNGVYCFQRDEKGWAFLFLAENENAMDFLISNCKDGIKNILSKYPKVEYFGGIGKAVFRLRKLRDSFHEAERAFAGRFIAEPDQIVTWSELHNKSEDELQVKGLGSMQKNRDLIEKFLRNGSGCEVDSFVDTYFTEILGENVRSRMMRQYVLMDIYICLIAFGQKIGIMEEVVEQECGEIQYIAEHIYSAEDLRTYVTKLVSSMIHLRDGISRDRYQDVIEAAQNYMKEHYMSEEISLGNVAASVAMSASYFSTIFSQETGRTFVEYLTELRMEKAKELLLCSNKKTSEIGYDVGYKDAHYFSSIFKKTQGYSPKEYRNRKRGEKG